MGDDVQAFKAGINGDRRYLRHQQSRSCRGRAVWRTKFEVCRVSGIGRRLDTADVRTVATDGTVIDALMAAVERGRGIVKAKHAGPAADRSSGVAVKSIEAALGSMRSSLECRALRETVAQERVNVAMLPAGVHG
jgi:hypothetical protein